MSGVGNAAHAGGEPAESGSADTFAWPKVPRRRKVANMAFWAAASLPWPL
jgi:hypothetical protein